MLEFKKTNDVLGSGLDYSVFGQGKKADGTYQEIVIAFRGSKNQLPAKDYIDSVRAMFGSLPTQAKELVDQTKAIVAKYNPDSVYATGHSLGGYLTQYFTAYVMQQTPELQAKMKHSAIFNPLLLIADEKSSPSLIKAREKTDQFVKESIINEDVSSTNMLYKSNSYVINGEFLADGIPKSQSAGLGALVGIGLSFIGPFGWLAGALGGAATGLLAGERLTKFGTYENAVRFVPEEKGWFDGHKMIRFYEKTDDLIQHFSFGSRHDKWQDGSNAYTKDSDNDGIADVVERYFYSDPNDANSVIAYAQLDGEQNGNDTPVVLYRLGNEQTDFSSQSLAKTEHILGNDMDNRLDGGVGNNILLGGKGKDIFVLGNNNFKNQETNLIVDFDAKEDKLDLSALKLSQITEGALFSNEAKENVALHWNAQTQTLNYQLDNQTFILAQFLNQTEVTMENILV